MQDIILKIYKQCFKQYFYVILLIKIPILVIKKKCFFLFIEYKFTTKLPRKKLLRQLTHKTVKNTKSQNQKCFILKTSI